ncbi:MAG: hypothetical protein U9Q81_24840 [Pseudomonadota bacterium]|nr:hypothetical protein [Pseudomonadota bacterium]
MEFLSALRDGELGARMAWPLDLEVTGQFPSGANLLDKRFQVGWHVGMSSLAMDLQPTNDAVLRSDTERFIRAAFESSTPRTNEAGWSPIVNFFCSYIDATRVLQCVYRTAYEPGNEIVVGDLLIPLAGGTLNVSAHARADLTGQREAVLAAQKMREGKDPDPPGFLPQHEIDDPRLDEKFPESPLSRVRRAMAWRIDDAGIEISEPSTGVTAREAIDLPRARCNVTPPPRYVYCRGVSESMSPTLDTLTRVAPPGTTGRTISVWRIDVAPISGWFRRRKLRTLAVGTTKQWHREGVSGLDISPLALSEHQGRLQLDFRATFVTRGMPIQSVQRWFLDDTGQPIRVAAGGPPTVAAEELAADVELVAGSWRPD